MTKIALLPGISPSPQALLAVELTRGAARAITITFDKDGDDMRVGWANISAKDLAAAAVALNAYAQRELLEVVNEASETPAS